MRNIGFLPARRASKQQQARRRDLGTQAFRARSQQGTNHVQGSIGYRRHFESAFRQGEILSSLVLRAIDSMPLEINFTR